MIQNDKNISTFDSALKLTQVQFHPTNKCNLNCVFCWIYNQDWKDKELSDKRILELTKEACEMGTQRITISGGGDPLVRPELVLQMMRTIKKHGIEGILITNGAILSDVLAEQAVKLDWDDIEFSVQASNTKLDQEIRGGKSPLDSTLKGIEKINVWKEKLKSSKPVMHFRMVITKKNYTDVLDMAKLVKKVGVQELHVRLVNEGGPFFEGDLSIKKEHFSDFLKILSETEAFCKQNNIKFETEFNPNNLKENNNEKAEQGEKELIGKQKIEKKALCKIPFTEMVVFGNGKISTCCNFFEYQFSKNPEKFWLDDVSEKSLKEVWNGKLFNEFRENISKKDLCDVCKQCSPDMLYHDEVHLG